jgi:hypothetical protein
MEQPKQIDITSPSVSMEMLYKLAFEHQKQVTNLLAQLQQVQSSLVILEAEISKRTKEN